MERTVEVVKDGDLILIYFNKREKYITNVKSGKSFYTYKAVIDFDEIIGLPYGSRIKLKSGVELVISRPNLEDIIYTSFIRRTQVLYPKDIGLIIIKSGIGPGSRVVEAGSGSGFLTAYIAYFIRPNGHVYSYEIRPEFIEIAKRNVAILGLDDLVTFKMQDITEGIDEDNVDAVILDMPSPWNVVRHAKAKLKHGGTFVSFVPTVNQMEKVVLELKRRNFIEVEATELIMRSYKVAMGETRPASVGISHTGYIVSARRP